MATSKKVAKKASKVLKDKRTSRAAKSVAASDLAQAKRTTKAKAKPKPKAAPKAKIKAAAKAKAAPRAKAATRTKRKPRQRDGRNRGGRGSSHRSTSNREDLTSGCEQHPPTEHHAPGAHHCQRTRAQATRAPRSLAARVLGHRNDYGFHPNEPPALDAPPSLACVMPYHETGPLACHAAGLAPRSLQHYVHSAPNRPSARLIVVDDGSRARPFRAPAAPASDSLQEFGDYGLERPTVRKLLVGLVLTQ